MGLLYDKAIGYMITRKLDFIFEQLKKSGSENDLKKAFIVL